MTNRCLFWIKDTDTKFHKCRTKCKDNEYFCCEKHTPKNLEEMLACCDMCCSELKVSDLIVLKCNHVYHKICYFKWLNKNGNNICPICNYTYKKHKKKQKKWVNKKNNVSSSVNTSSDNILPTISTSNINITSVNTSSVNIPSLNIPSVNTSSFNNFNTGITNNNNNISDIENSLKPTENIHIPVGITDNNNNDNELENSLKDLISISKEISANKSINTSDNINNNNDNKFIDKQNYDEVFNMLNDLWDKIEKV